MHGETRKRIERLLDELTTLVITARRFIENRNQTDSKERPCQECNEQPAHYETEWNTEVCGECWDEITNGAKRPATAF
ncbi:hypothetical protein LCGC14_0320320 [marine sediment metagenome]|uniref:Uncharacterized protein n=1 Tax=marine sediment metagenome TaxID=412755 RepID=A0A0F9TQ24_9ZZZZ